MTTTKKTETSSAKTKKASATKRAAATKSTSTPATKSKASPRSAAAKKAGGANAAKSTTKKSAGKTAAKRAAAEAKPKTAGTTRAKATAGAAPKSDASTKTASNKKASVKSTAKKAAPTTKKAAATKKAAQKKEESPKKVETKVDRATDTVTAGKMKSTAPKTASPQKPSAKSAKKKTVKNTSVKASAEQPKSPPRRLNVGQKPRGEKSEATILPTSLRDAERDAAPIESASKGVPAAKEAKQAFKVNDHVVYPAHGVGHIVAVEKQIIAGFTNEVFVIDFEQEKLTLKVPTAKAASARMRPLSDDATIAKALETLKGRARVKRTMWSRRAQEYEAKINSGDIIAVAEVVRDLYRATDQPEQSYSERQLFEAALDRLAREVAAVRKCDLDGAIAEIDGYLQQKKAA